MVLNLLNLSTASHMEKKRVLKHNLAFVSVENQRQDSQLQERKQSCCAKCKQRACKISQIDGVSVDKHLPIYGMPDDKRPEYCSKCVKPGMVNLNIKDKNCPCGTIATFGIKGENQ
jgi:hypothetical protein